MCNFQRMKITISQLDEEVNEKDVKMQQLKSENDQLYHQLVSRSVDKISVGCQTIGSVDKISVGCQTIKVSIIM